LTLYGDQFKEKVAIITGAGGGIGQAYAEALAREGAAVVVADINTEGAQKVTDGIKGEGGMALALHVDVSDPDSVAAAMAAAASELGRPQVIVNSAGIGRFAHTHELPFADWQRILGVNLTGTFLVCQAALPHLMDGGGSIVNIASNAGIKSQPYSIAYCASKAGVVHLTRCLADEYIKRGVRANCVAPGGMETPLQQAFMEFPEGVEWKALRKVMSPLGNSQPEEIANVVAFIASDECRYMTGSIVSIDGGITV